MGAVTASLMLRGCSVDEWALNYLHDFDGTPLQSVAKARLIWASCSTKTKRKPLKPPLKPSNPCWQKAVCPPTQRLT